MNRTIIGVAPGTSGYGADAVLTEVSGTGLEVAVRIVHSCHHPYPRDLHHLLLRLGSGDPVEIKYLGFLHRVLGETLAIAARQVADQARFSLQQVLCAGCAGHPVWQEPDSRYPSLLDAGMAEIVAERTGLTIVSGFRSRDLAAGGMAAPIEALADWLLLRHPRENRAVVHLGGTAAVVFLPAQGNERNVLGFDVGPCNQFLDSLVRHLTGGREKGDPGGKLAVQGRCLDELLATWLDHPWWQKRPPRSLSPSVFGDAFAAQLARQAKERQLDRNDLLCTATHLVARGISTAIRRFLPPPTTTDRILLSGGGIRNGLLWQLLESQLPGTVLTRTDHAGVPAECRRALAFAILAALALDAVPGNVPAATGASGARLIGSLTPGSPGNWARCTTWMAQQTGMSYRLAS